MKVFICVLLAVAAQAAPKADPAYLTYGLPYAAHHVGAYAAPAVATYAAPAVATYNAPTVATYAAPAVATYAAPAVATYAAAVVPKVETEVTALNNAVPVAVGGYKAVAGDNGELKGAVHEVPAVFGAAALNKQVNDASQGSLTVGTDAVVTAKVTGYKTVATPFVHYGKREAEADPAYLTYGLPYAAHHVGAFAAPAVASYAAPAVASYAAPAVATYAAPAVATYAAPAVATYAAAVVPKVETEVTALNNAVPVAVGGYKAVAGDNGELKGAVHEVPAVFGAAALNKQVNDASQGSLTVGTDAVVTAKVTGYNTVATPFVHYGKREAEADPALLYSTYGYTVPTTYKYTAPATYKYTAPATYKYTAPATYGFPAYGLGYHYGNAAYGYAGYPLHG